MFRATGGKLKFIQQFRRYGTPANVKVLKDLPVEKPVPTPSLPRRVPNSLPRRVPNSITSVSSCRRFKRTPLPRELIRPRCEHSGIEVPVDVLQRNGHLRKLLRPTPSVYPVHPWVNCSHGSAIKLTKTKRKRTERTDPWSYWGLAWNQRCTK